MKRSVLLAVMCVVVVLASSCSGDRKEELITAPQVKKATTTTVSENEDEAPGDRAAASTSTPTSTTAADGSSTTTAATTVKGTSETNGANGSNGSNGAKVTKSPTTTRRATTTTRRPSTTTRRPTGSVPPTTVKTPVRTPATTTRAPTTTATPTTSFILTPPTPTTTLAPPSPVALSGAPVSATNSWVARGTFDCGSDEATVSASGAASIAVGPATVYVGTYGGDPRVARFDYGIQTFCRDDLERTGADHRGHGLAWTGSELLVLVSAPPPSGSSTDDLRAWTGGGWLDFYDAATTAPGQGRVEALVGLNSLTGAPVNGTFLTSLSSAGGTEGFVVRAMRTVVPGLQLDVTVDGSPRNSDRAAMACATASPYSGRYTISFDLATMVEVVFAACS